MSIEDINKAKVPIVKIDKKLEMANKLLAKAKLPEQIKVH